MHVMVFGLLESPQFSFVFDKKRFSRVAAGWQLHRIAGGIPLQVGSPSFVKAGSFSGPNCTQYLRGNMQLVRARPSRGCGVSVLLLLCRRCGEAFLAFPFRALSVREYAHSYDSSVRRRHLNCCV